LSEATEAWLRSVKRGVLWARAVDLSGYRWLGTGADFLRADTSVAKKSSFQNEAVAETGNIILNSWVATIANLLRKTQPNSLPVVVRGDGKSIFEVGESAKTFVLFLRIRFEISNGAIHGDVALLMDIPSIEELRSLVAVFVIHVTQNGTKEIAAADGPKNSRACGLIGFRYEKRRRRHPRGALL
jgi:hypothetical protein